jgi:hypothetical protein
MFVVIIGENGRPGKVVRVAGLFESVKVAEQELETQGWRAATGFWRFGVRNLPDVRLFYKDGNWAHAQELDKSV